MEDISSFKHSSLSSYLIGLQLLVGGKFISLCSLDGGDSDRHLSPEKPDLRRASEQENRTWKEVFCIDVASPVIHLKFSPDGTMFASAAKVLATS